MKKAKIILTILVVFFLFGTLSVGAQEKNVSEGKTEDCFTYDPGNVFVSLNIPAAGFPSIKFIGGNVVGINFFLSNGSNLAIPDLDILVRVEKKGEVNKLVDEFFLPEKTALKPKERKDLNYEWVIPAGIEPGEYVFSAMPIRGKNLNVGVVNFGVIEKIASLNNDNGIKIEGTPAGEIGVKDFKIGGESYEGQGIDFEKNENLKFTGVLENTYSEKKNASIEYKLYQGNYFSEENMVVSKKEEVSIDAKKQTEIGFDISRDKLRTDFPGTYYLKIKIKYGENTRIYTLTFLNNKKYKWDGTTLNYVPFLTNFPTKDKEKSKLAFCFDYPSKAQKGELKLTLKDEDGKVVSQLSRDFDSMTESGYFSTEVENSSDWFALEAEFSMNGKIVDRYETIYNSEDFGVAKREKSSVPGKFDSQGVGKIVQKKGVLISIIIVLLLILGAIIFFFKKRNNGGTGAMVVFLLVAVSVFGFSHSAKAGYGPNPLRIDQLMMGLSIPDLSDDIGFNCGGVTSMMFSGSIVPYNLRVGSTNGSTSVTQNGDTIKFSSTGGNIKFQFAKDFGFPAMEPTANGWALKVPSAANDLKWGLYSDPFHPYWLAGGLFGDIDASDNEFFWKSGKMFTYGRTNFFTLMLGYGYSVNPFGVAAAAGLYANFMFPHFFDNINNVVLDAGAGCDGFVLADCKKNCMDRYLPCRKTCCAEGGFTKIKDDCYWNNWSDIPQEGYWINPLDADSWDVANCLKKKCVELNNPFGFDGDFNPLNNEIGCYNKCEQTQIMCNSNVLQNWLSGQNKLDIKKGINDLLHKDADLVISHDNSVIKCSLENYGGHSNWSSSTTGECAFENPGKVDVTVKLQPRSSFSALWPLGIAGFYGLAGCVVGPSPIPWVGYNISPDNVFPAEKTYSVIVGGRTLTVNATGNCWNTANYLPKATITESGYASKGTFNFPIASVINGKPVTSATSVTVKPVPATGTGPLISWTGCSNVVNGECIVDYAANEDSKVVTANFDCFDLNVEKYNMLNSNGNGVGDSIVNVEYQDGSGSIVSVAKGTRTGSKTISQGGVAINKSIKVSVDRLSEDTYYKIFVKDRSSNWPGSPVSCPSAGNLDCVFPMGTASKDIRVQYYPNIRINKAGSCPVQFSNSSTTQPTPANSGTTNFDYVGYYNLPFSTDYYNSSLSIPINLNIIPSTTTGSLAWDFSPVSNFVSNPSCTGTSCNVSIKRGAEIHLNAQCDCDCTGRCSEYTCGPNECGVKCGVCTGLPEGCNCDRPCKDCSIENAAVCPSTDSGWHEEKPN